MIAVAQDEGQDLPVEMLAYLTTDEGDLVLFESEEEAITVLRAEHGMTDAYIATLIFVELD